MMKVAPVHILGVAAAAVGLAFLFGDDSKNPEVGHAEPGEEGETPRVGFAPEQLAELFIPRRPGALDLERWEQNKPTVGTFFQVPRKYMILGTGPKSITWMALYRAANWCLLHRGATPEEANDHAERVAYSGDMRSRYGDLIMASVWNDTLYGTWGCGRRSPVGPHGRGIPLEACHADNRARLLAARPPARVIPLGVPLDRGSGSAIGVTGKCRPYIWLPMLNMDAFLEGEVTTRDVVWPGPERVSGLEPPPEFWALGMEVS